MKKPIKKILAASPRKVELEEWSILVNDRLLEFMLKINEIIDRVNELYDNQK